LAPNWIKLIPIMICIVAVGALDSPLDALLFSIDSMSTRGASGLTLQQHWQLMGALEAVNGMLLFGVSTAYLIAQVYWSMIAAHVTPSKI